MYQILLINKIWPHATLAAIMCIWATLYGPSITTHFLGLLLREVKISAQKNSGIQSWKRTFSCDWQQFIPRYFRAKWYIFKISRSQYYIVEAEIMIDRFSFLWGIPTIKIGFWGYSSSAWVGDIIMKISTRNSPSAASEFEKLFFFDVFYSCSIKN